MQMFIEKKRKTKKKHKKTLSTFDLRTTLIVRILISLYEYSRIT